MSVAAWPVDLTAHPGVWWASRAPVAGGGVCASGHPALDAELPGRGWPLGALCELICAHPGWGEWALTLPALAQVAQAGRRVVLVGAPWAPYAPGLQARGLAPQALLWVDVADARDRLWAAEQALACTDVGAVLLWWPLAPGRSAPRVLDALRRLQRRVATRADQLLWVVRSAARGDAPSPAVLRLGVTPGAAAQTRVALHANGATGGGDEAGDPAGPRIMGSTPLTLRVLKRRGAPCTQCLQLGSA